MPTNGEREGAVVAQATINQDLDLIKSFIEVKRVAACRAAVCDRDGDTPEKTSQLGASSYLSDQVYVAFHTG